MSVSSIFFFNEDHNYQPKQKRILKSWILDTIKEESHELENLNYIFCSDEYLYKMNVDYLQHDTYTDVITFDNSEKGSKTIVGDIFISIDRIKDNAKSMNLKFEDELHRVIIHGTLHLLGYKDKSKKDEQVMRSKEDYYLSKRLFHVKP